MADTWRYRFYQVQNGLPGFTSESFMFDLPLNSASFSSILQQTGQFSGTVQLTDPGVQAILAQQPPLHLLCDRTAIYVELNGQLVWGGLLQQVDYDSLSQQVKLQGMDWWGYFNQGRIISWNSSYTGCDQLAIAADLMNIAQGASSNLTVTGRQSPPVHFGYVVGGNVGVQLGQTAAGALAGTVTSGVTLTVAWAAAAFKNVGQAISDIGVSALGFDWSIDVAYAAGIPTKTFNLWYPRAGRTTQQQVNAGSEVVFDMGSTSGVQYNWTAGQVATANILFGAGSGSGNSAIAAEAADPALLQQGWPVLENSVSFTDIISQGLLDKVTLAHLYALRYPVSQLKVRYAAGSDSNQPLGSFALGDDCRLMIPPDPYWPSGYDSSGTATGSNWWRVQQVTTTVNDEGKSWMELVLGLPPVLPGT